jgi:hypothetical protein
MTRCKFKVESKTEFVSGVSILLRPVTCGSIENEKFYQYTPGGELRLEVVNKETATKFEPGKEYYIDISPAEQKG